MPGSGCSGGGRALEGAGGVLEGAQRGFGAFTAFIEVKAVAEVELGGQVQAGLPVE